MPEEKKLVQKGKSLQEFRQQFDKGFIVPQKIRAGLKALAGGWEYEVNFAKLAGVNLSDLAAFRDQFSDYWVALAGESRGRRAWAATPSLAKAMREML